LRHDRRVTIDAESSRDDGTPRLGWRVVPLVLAECRPVVLAMFALRFVAGVALGTASGWAALPTARWLDVVVGVIAWGCVTGFVYLLNGISDIAGDRLNGSTRPLAGGRLSSRVATGWCVAFAVAGVALSALVGLGLLSCTATMIALGWLYSGGRHAAKQRVWSASLVIAGGGFVTYIGGVYSAGAVPSAEAAAIATLMAAWMAVAGNTKDLGDIAGDRAAGRRTLPVVLGTRPAAWVIAVACCAVGLAGLAVDSSLARAVAACLLLAALVMVGLAVRGRNLGSKRMYAVFMVSQLVTNLMIVVVA
jgi:4-hydroxybenzoate polyprenyltransferase